MESRFLRRVRGKRSVLRPTRTTEVPFEFLGADDCGWAAYPPGVVGHQSVAGSMSAV